MCPPRAKPSQGAMAQRGRGCSWGWNADLHARAKRLGRSVIAGQKIVERNTWILLGNGPIRFSFSDGMPSPCAQWGDCLGVGCGWRSSPWGRAPHVQCLADLNLISAQTVPFLDVFDADPAAAGDGAKNFSGTDHMLPKVSGSVRLRSPSAPFFNGKGGRFRRLHQCRWEPHFVSCGV